jgi:organic radical activating enzyme
MMRLSIILNFSENGNHGCRFKCSFCSWRTQPEHKMLLKPNFEDIDRLIEKSPKAKVITISGGGDPLYNYEKNRDYLISLIGYIKSKGLAVEIITREFEIIKENLNDFKEVYWSFSEEFLNQSLLGLIKQIGRRHIRLSIIHDFDYDRLQRYADFYAPHVRLIYVRENYLKPEMTQTQLLEFRKRFNKRKNLELLRTKDCNKQYLLIGNEIRNAIEKPFNYGIESR